MRILCVLATASAALAAGCAVAPYGAPYSVSTVPYGAFGMPYPVEHPGLLYGAGPAYGHGYGYGYGHDYGYPAPYPGAYYGGYGGFQGVYPVAPVVVYPGRHVHPRDRLGAPRAHPHPQPRPRVRPSPPDGAVPVVRTPRAGGSGWRPDARDAGRGEPSFGQGDPGRFGGGGSGYVPNRPPDR